MLKLKNYERIGSSEEVCWKDFVRENHHRFCEVITKKLLKDLVRKDLVYWISNISKSHGERNIHNHTFGTSPLQSMTQSIFIRRL